MKFCFMLCLVHSESHCYFFKQHTLHCWKEKVKKCLPPSSLEEQEFTIFSSPSLLRVWRFACTNYIYIFQSILVSLDWWTSFTLLLQEVDPCEDLTDDDIRTAIQNATGPRSALFVPDVGFLACLGLPSIHVFSHLF